MPQIRRCSISGFLDIAGDPEPPASPIEDLLLPDEAERDVEDARAFGLDRRSSRGGLGSRAPPRRLALAIASAGLAATALVALSVSRTTSSLQAPASVLDGVRLNEDNASAAPAPEVDVSSGSSEQEAPPQFNTTLPLVFSDDAVAPSNSSAQGKEVEVSSGSSEQVVSKKDSWGKSYTDTDEKEARDIQTSKGIEMPPPLKTTPPLVFASDAGVPSTSTSPKEEVEVSSGSSEQVVSKKDSWGKSYTDTDEEEARDIQTSKGIEMPPPLKTTPPLVFAGDAGVPSTSTSPKEDEKPEPEPAAKSTAAPTGSDSNADQLVNSSAGGSVVVHPPSFAGETGLEKAMASAEEAKKAGMKASVDASMDDSGAESAVEPEDGSSPGETSPVSGEQGEEKVAKLTGALDHPGDLNPMKFLKPLELRHDGNVCDTEEELWGGLCYKKCSELTNGEKRHRKGPWTCCDNQPCDSVGQVAKAGFSNPFTAAKTCLGHCDGKMGDSVICGGYDVAGDGSCPHKPGACLTDEELHIGMCYKKCSILTNGTYPWRSAAATCCKADSELGCMKPGASMTSSEFDVGGGAGDDDNSTPSGIHMPDSDLTEDKDSAWKVLNGMMDKADGKEQVEGSGPGGGPLPKNLKPSEFMHDGNVCGDTEESYAGLCYRKCSLLTNGDAPFRTSAWTCCKSKPCGLTNEVKAPGAPMFCHGFGVGGDGACPHKPGVCLDDEELYLGLCYKKCSILTDGKYQHRFSAVECCDSTGLGCLVPTHIKLSKDFAVGGGEGDGDPSTPSSAHAPLEELTESSGSDDESGAASEDHEPKDIATEMVTGSVMNPSLGGASGGSESDSGSGENKAENEQEKLRLEASAAAAANFHSNAAAQKADQKANAAEEKAGTEKKLPAIWEVAVDGNVNVRREPSTQSEVISVKKKGAMFRGKEMGTWVELVDESGYMLARTDKITLLKKVDMMMTTSDLTR